jgi:membrane protein
MTSPVGTRRDAPPAATGGEQAEHPGEISAEGWKAVAGRVIDRVKRDHVPLNAAGVAFWAFLSTIPAMIALVSLYGLVADPDDIEQRVEDLGGALPDEARELVVQQLESITAASGGALTVGLLVSVAVALWSASSGMNYLIEALNVAYRRTESRGFVRRRGTALIFTLGALAFAAMTIAAITALPAILAASGLAGGLRWLISLAVWPLVGVGLVVGLAILYRHGPDREPEARWAWVSPGSIFAVVTWIVASVGFQIYAGNFGSYNETYGSLGAVVILLIWLLLSALVVLVGAELNCELERQTTADTTDDD